MTERPPFRKLVFYYGLPLAGLAIVGGTELLAAHSPLAGVGITFCGLAVAAEGLGLAVNWRGGASAFVAMLRRQEDNVLVRIFPAWGVRIGGATIAVIGLILLGSGVARIAA